MLARIQKSLKEKDEGFTLIELLVVIIIIGILAAIAIPVFLNQRKKAVDTSIKSDLRSAANELESKYVDNQVYPTAAAASDVLLAVPDLKVSTGNTLTFVAAVDGSSVAYCLKGHNGKATQDFWYDSDGGGLKNVACT